MATEVMLTTIDNPFDPFTQFDEWLSFDESKGYYSSNYLARIANTSNALSDEDNNIIIANAIDEIVKFDPIGIYVKAFKKTKQIN